MQEHQKLNIVSSIRDENELRVGLVIPLLSKMGFIRVLDNQSMNECGIDVVAENKNELGRPIYTGIVLKKENIDKKVGTNTHLLRTITDQIQEAWDHEITHPDIPDRSYISRVWLITKGKISRQAKDYIEKTCRKQSSQNRNLETLDQSDLVHLLDKYWPEYYEDQRPFISQYHKKLCNDVFGVDLTMVGVGKTKKLTDIFIDPLLEVVDDVSEAGQLSLNIGAEQINCEDFLKRKDKFSFVFAGAGGGKTVLLKRLAVKKAEKRDEIPILFHARVFSEVNIDVREICNQALKRFSDSFDSDIFKQVEEEKLLFLVDGLDELADQTNRMQALTNLIKISSDKSSELEIRIIIASRH